MKKHTIILEIDTCDECPHCTTRRTPHAGDALDFYCKKKMTYLRNPLTNKITEIPTKITGYVESYSEFPEPPSWCPCLFKSEEKNNEINSNH